MRRLLSVQAIALGLVLALSSAAQAQVFTPTYTSPRLVNEMGVSVSDRPGNLAVEGLWRGGPIGLRVGYAGGEEGMFSLGGEFRNPLMVTGAPMGLAFTAAGQALLGDQDALGFQAGLSAGYTFTGEGLSFTPYLHPRIGLVREHGLDEFDVKPLADVGVDVEFYNNALIRLGVNLGDVGARWGVGVGIRR